MLGQVFPVSFKILPETPFKPGIIDATNPPIDVDSRLRQKVSRFFALSCRLLSTDLVLAEEFWRSLPLQSFFGQSVIISVLSFDTT